MSKHTPGPWIAQRGRSYLDEQECWMVPGVAHCGDAEASEANARLIAATPEMHEALCSLVRQVEEFRSWDEKDWPAALAALSAHAQAARGLIARAEGRES